MAQRKPSPFLSVEPCRGLVDEPFAVQVRSLPPGHRVTLHSLNHSEDGDLWEAFGHYVSDAAGLVNVANDASMGGTYHGVEPMGLLWSIRPVPGSRPGIRLRKKEVQTPMVVHICVYQGHLSQGFREQAPLASAVVERWYIAPGVRRVDVREDGVTGTLFLPPGPGPFSGLLDLWGGGGGLVEYRSALLASRGFASLALEYMTPRTSQGSTKHVGIQYFEAAFRVLQQHPQVRGDRIAVLGLSFGVSVALGLTVYSDVFQPRCLVCVSGSHVHPVKGSISDIFSEIEKNVRNTRYDEENRAIWRDLLLPIPNDPLKKVDVGRLRCPVLMVVGEDDQNWPTAESAEDMRQMMERAGNGHLLTVLSYPGAGHLIEPPYSPLTRASNLMTPQREKVLVLWGGETALHSHAQEDSWKKTLDFLEEHLYRSTETIISEEPMAELPYI